MAVRVDKKQVYIQEIHFKIKDSDRLEVKEWRKIYHVSTDMIVELALLRKLEKLY